MTALLDQIAFRLDGRDYFIKLSMIITDDLFVVKNLKMAFAKVNILRQTKAFVWLSPEYKYVRTYNISKTRMPYAKQGNSYAKLWIRSGQSKIQGYDCKFCPMNTACLYKIVPMESEGDNELLLSTY